MPVGIQRLNQQGRHHTNDRIIFIKPLPGPTASIAEDFLSRIAAQCLPLMKQHSLSVMTLEEHEPNREFVGRNFNAGEIVQLVLHPLGNTGRWLPFKYVQMVMMHELAHCKEMNHSRAFWKVRNQYAEDMRGLWSNGYTGEGLWGRGQTLYSGQYDDTETPDASELPEHLCGGTYRSRRKRKRGANAQGEKPSYQERKQKWIEKKFGKEGQDLGGDESMRRHLEKGKLSLSQPRVAKSKRGRDLRAEAAALRMRRLQAEKEAEEAIKREDEEVVGEETEDDGDEADVTGVDGNRITDKEGRGMVKVCEDEDEDDEGARNEMAELSQMGSSSKKRAWAPARKGGKPKADHAAEEDVSTTEDESEDGEQSKLIDTAPREFSRLRKSPRSTPQKKASGFTNRAAARKPDVNGTAAGRVYHHDDEPQTLVQPPLPKAQSPSLESVSYVAAPAAKANTAPAPLVSSTEPTVPATSAPAKPLEAPPLKLRPPLPPPQPVEQSCSICSFANDPQALTCIACAHVLDTTKLTRHWRCVSEVCEGSEYVNSDDVGRCGVCDAARIMSGE